MTRLLLLLLVLSASLFAQKSETCKSCPVDLDEQLPEKPLSQAETRVFFTKSFFIPHFVVQPLAIGFDETMTLQGQKHGRCVEGGLAGVRERVHFKELFLTDLATSGSETALEYVFAKSLKHGSSSDKKWFFWLPHVMSGPQTVLHIKGGIDWYTRCW